MNDKQNAKLNMAQRVSEIFSRYENEYKAVPAMVSAVKALNTDIKNIREVIKEQGSVNVSASTQEKRMAEKNMIRPCVKMANALYVIGFTSNDKELITLQGTSDYSFYRTSGNIALALAKRILELTHKYKEKLRDYGIKPEEIDETELLKELENNLLEINNL